MPKRLPASLVEIVLRSAITGWIAALYGALYIYAKADFATTGTLWLFTWPFFLILAIATLTHLVLVGLGGRWVPSPVAWVRDLNRVLATREPEDLSLAAGQGFMPVGHRVRGFRFGRLKGEVG